MLAIQVDHFATLWHNDEILAKLLLRGGENPVKELLTK